MPFFLSSTFRGLYVPKKPYNKEWLARLIAVQACYQMSQNKQPVQTVIQDYLDRGQAVDRDGTVLGKPDGALFKKILSNMGGRMPEMTEILTAHLENKDMEPLLKAILLCGAYELLAHEDIDAPLIIDDYLNITHGFYEQQQVSLVNGILDKVSTLIRGPSGPT